MLSRVFFSSKIVFIGFKCHEIDHITFSDYTIFFVLTLMVYHTWLPLDRKFNNDENSYKKHGLKIICSDAVMSQSMSRDQGGSCQYKSPL